MKRHPVLTAIFILVVTLTASVRTDIPANAENVQKGLTEAAITMYPCMTKELKAVKPDKAVRWTSSDPKIVKILGTKGAKKQTVTLQSGTKAGSCIIRAKVEKKIFQCRVTVKRDAKIARAKLVKVKPSGKSIVVTVSLQNPSKKKLWYGHGYWVEKFSVGKWKKVKADWNLAFTAEAFSLAQGEKTTISYRITDMYRKSSLKKGVYRLHVNYGVSKKAYQYVLFEVK